MPTWMDISSSNRCGVPVLSESSLKDGIECCDIETHRGDECAIALALVQALPRSSESWIGKQIVADQVQASWVQPAHSLLTCILDAGNEEGHGGVSMIYIVHVVVLIILVSLQQA